MRLSGLQRHLSLGVAHLRMAVAARRVANSFKELVNDPIEGVLAEIPDESNLFLWHIWMDGPPGSPYEGGIFQLQLEFPDDFPMSPPVLSFLSQFWHPNVYRDGKVCISILHPPGEDETSGELASERWMPTQTVASIMLSVISMLNDPNLSSPANVEASVMFRDRRSEFNDRCSVLVATAQSLVPAHVKIPHPETNEQERQRALLKHRVMDEEEFGVESQPLDVSDDGLGSEEALAFIVDDEDDVVVEEPSDEAKPPRKKKKTSAKEKSSPEDAAVKKSAKTKANGKKAPVSANAANAANEANEGSEDAKKVQKPKRERVDQVEVDDEPLTETESASSSMDAKELENLLQPDAEFKQWKRTWQPLVVWKATNKGWTAMKGVAGAGNGPKTTKSSKSLSGLSGDLTVLTYNVLRHSTAEGAHRAAEQIRLLRDANAHVMVLNDVSPSFQQQLGEQAAFLGYYAVYAHHLISDTTSSSTTQSRMERMDQSTTPETLVKGANSLIISKSRILQAQLLSLPSRTERNLIRVECEGTSSHSLVIIAAHLDDSPRDVKLRVQQLAQLNKAAEGFTNTPQVQFYVGDLGLSAGTKEHKVISNHLTDAWTALHPGDPGLTYDPDSNKMVKVLSTSAQPTRRDRILFKSDTLSISPTFAQLIGTSKLSHKYKGAPVWPSDHYALLASFAGMEETSTPKKSSKCTIC